MKINIGEVMMQVFLANKHEKPDFVCPFCRAHMRDRSEPYDSCSGDPIGEDDAIIECPICERRYRVERTISYHYSVRDASFKS